MIQAIPQRYLWNTENTQLLYVSINSGSNTAGDGSELNPYQTIPFAMSIIAAHGDNTGTKFYSIMLFPGVYNTANGNDFIFLSNTIINSVDQAPYSTIIDCVFDIDPGATSSPLGFSNVNIRNTLGSNTVIIPANIIFVNYFGVYNSELICNSSGGGSQLVFKTMFAAGVTVDSVSQVIMDTTINLGNITITDAIAVGVNAIMGDSFTLGDVSINTSVGSNILLLGHTIGGTLITNSQVALTTDQIPFSHSIGGTYFRNSDCYGSSYTPGDINQWPIVPTNVKDALDYLAPAKRKSVVSTIDATTALLDTIAIPLDSVMIFRSEISARKTNGIGAGVTGEGNTYINTVSVKNITGVVTMGVVQNDFISEDIPGFVISFSISGTDILIEVTGVVDDNIDWVGETLLSVINN